jgi:putative flippase GtrA
MKKLFRSVCSICVGKNELMLAFVAPTKSIRWQIPRAFLASVVAAVVDFGFLVLLVEAFRVKAELAAVVSYLVGGVVNYLLCSKWVFPTAPNSVAVGFTFFTLLSLVGLGITWACMFLLHGRWGLHYTLAKCVALGLAFCWNFLSRKALLFRE